MNYIWIQQIKWGSVIYLFTVLYNMFFTAGRHIESAVVVQELELAINLIL